MSAQKSNFSEKQQIAVVVWLGAWVLPAGFVLVNELIGWLPKLLAVAWIVGFILLSYKLPKFWQCLLAKYFNLWSK